MTAEPNIPVPASVAVLPFALPATSGTARPTAEVQFLAEEEDAGRHKADEEGVGNLVILFCVSFLISFGLFYTCMLAFESCPFVFPSTPPPLLRHTNVTMEDIVLEILAMREDPGPSRR